MTLKPLSWRPSGLVAGLLLSLAVVGCASNATLTPEQVVQQRSEQYWKARQAGNVEAMYQLASPAYRKVRTQEQFRLQFGTAAAVNSVEVVKVTCEPEKCTSRIKLGVTPSIVGIKVGTIDTYLDEVWLLEDGQWWHHHDL